MQAAVRWVRANAAARRLDPDRIATGGFSAGATMSVATAYNSDDPGNSGNPGYSSRVTAAIGTGTLNVPLVDIHPDPLVEPPVGMFHGAERPVALPRPRGHLPGRAGDAQRVRGPAVRRGGAQQPQRHRRLAGLPLQVGRPADRRSRCRCPQGTLPTVPAVRIPSSLVPKNLLPGPL